MGWYEYLHPVVASPLPEMSSTENLAAVGPVARHLNAPARRAWNCRSIDYFAPLPVTPRGNTYILLFTDRFSRRSNMYAFTAAEFTVEGTANIRINGYIPLWGCYRSRLSDNGLPFCSKLSQAVYKLLGVRKIATSSYHPNSNGGVERVNHTMAHCWQ